MRNFDTLSINFASHMDICDDRVVGHKSAKTSGRMFSPAGRAAASG